MFSLESSRMLGLYFVSCISGLFFDTPLPSFFCFLWLMWIYGPNTFASCRSERERPCIGNPRCGEGCIRLGSAGVSEGG